MPQYNVAPVPLGAIDRGVIFQDVLRRVRSFVGVEAAVAAGNLHVQSPGLDLAELAVTEPSIPVSTPLGIQSPSLDPSPLLGVILLRCGRRHQRRDYGAIVRKVEQGSQV